MFELIVKIIILILFSVCDGNAESTELDLPKCGDMNTYIMALERATSFCLSIKDAIDPNLSYGIFTTRVNIDLALKMKLPKSIRKRMRKFAGDIKWLTHMLPIHSSFGLPIARLLKPVTLRDFQRKHNLPQYLEGDPFNRLSVMYAIKQFNTRRHLYDYLLGNIEEIFANMEMYEHRVLDLKATMPNPHLSDHCINEVLSNPKSGEFTKCYLHPDCKEALIFGDNYGYGVTHRVLLIMMMHQSRSCFAFSDSEDNEIVHKLCSYMYHEAKYIMINEGSLLDLVIENSVLCAQMGYEIFLNRHWMKKALSLQTPQGCFFNLKRPNEIIEIQNSTKQPCDLHLTAVIMADLSIFIRYLVEKCLRYAK